MKTHVEMTEKQLKVNNKLSARKKPSKVRKNFFQSENRLQSLRKHWKV